MAIRGFMSYCIVSACCGVWFSRLLVCARLIRACARCSGVNNFITSQSAGVQRTTARYFLSVDGLRPCPRFAPPWKTKSPFRGSFLRWAHSSPHKIYHSETAHFSPVVCSPPSTLPGFKPGINPFIPGGSYRFCRVQTAPIMGFIPVRVGFKLGGSYHSTLR